MSTQRILFTADSGVLAVVIPSGEVPINDLAASAVPVGTPYVIVDESNIPSDRTFRGAWKTDENNNIYEDLELSRAIAIEKVKVVAAEAAIAAQKAELLYEDTPYSTTQIRDAYASCKATLEGASTTQEMKHCLMNYVFTYSV